MTSALLADYVKPDYKFVSLRYFLKRREVLQVCQLSVAGKFDTLG
jgi:hypothetical protein